ncbi:MAG: hypothetical protein HKN73_01840 [Gemmatimonadetes bacterium]|nr:hypothetical protein [Gemmatimonadota bacterium]
MRLPDLEHLPDEARIWIFAADRPMPEDESRAVLEAVDGFLEDWAAHGVPLSGARDWRHDRFLVVGVDESLAPPSGCSIDALVGVLKDLEVRLGVRFLGNESVWYRTDEGVHRATRGEFKGKAQRGEVTPDVVVFDNAVTRLADLREGRWEGPARERWHGPAFFGG